MRSKKQLCGIVGIALLLFLLLYLFLIWPAQKRYNVSHAEVLRKSTTLRTFLARPNGPPAKEEIEVLNKEIKVLKERYREIEKAFISERKEKIDITPVEFGKILHETKKNLLKEAEYAGLAIPPDLGFKETIPTAEEVVIMARELEAITFIVRKAIASRLGDIRDIKYRGVEIGPPWEKVEVELEIYGSFKDIVNFFYKLNQNGKIYIIKSLDIKSAAEKLSEDSVSAVVSLVSYIYIARHGD